MIIKSGADILNICEQEKISIAELAIRYETKRSGVSREYVIDKMQKTFEQMQKSIKEGMKKQDSGYEIGGKMFRDYGKKIDQYSQNVNPLLGTEASQAVAYAVSVMEVNCSMGKVVASPTAGSCGVLPAAILSCMETQNLDDAKAVEGLFAAGLVGSIIGRNASLSGAKGGCQAEIGSAAAMAAAAIVEMSGGTPKMALDAAAYTIKNIMGLVCDPVAGLVEIPCVKRNGLGVLNALMCADMALAGIESVVPFDEVIWAMDRVGRQMPEAMKETSEGGIADTATARKIEKEIFEKDWN
ncbi:MAG: L-serine ammonia-lyase, iron-sulfur-dependent, subunit alpha [Eubacteriales bacterium]